MNHFFIFQPNAHNMLNTITVEGPNCLGSLVFGGFTAKCWAILQCMRQFILSLPVCLSNEVTYIPSSCLFFPFFPIRLFLPLLFLSYFIYLFYCYFFRFSLPLFCSFIIMIYLRILVHYFAFFLYFFLSSFRLSQRFFYLFCLIFLSIYLFVFVFLRLFYLLLLSFFSFVRLYISYLYITFVYFFVSIPFLLLFVALFIFFVPLVSFISFRNVTQ